jgi:soluble lytic murein transglycosylase-like protein
LLAILVFTKKASGEDLNVKAIPTYSDHFLVAYNSILSPIEAFKEETKNIIITKAVRNNIDPELFLEIARCESGLDPRAKNLKSSASGLYQFLPSTWLSWGSGDVFDVNDNVDAAVRLFLVKGVKPWLASKACWQTNYARK